MPGRNDSGNELIGLCMEREFFGLRGRILTSIHGRG